MNICYSCFNINNEYIKCFKCDSKVCFNCININYFYFCNDTLLYKFKCPFCYT